MAHVHDPIVVESDRSDSGMGLGMVLGILLAMLLVLGIVWFGFFGRAVSNQPVTPPTNSGPTIINPPAIQVPDTITINPPAPAPQPAPAQ